MNYDMLTIEPPTDEQWRALDRDSKLFWARVYTLMHECGADLDTAIRAVQSADQERNK
jgi:hypothetical protein